MLESSDLLMLMELRGCTFLLETVQLRQTGSRSESCRARPRFKGHATNWQLVVVKDAKAAAAAKNLALSTASRQLEKECATRLASDSPKTLNVIASGLSRPLGQRKRPSLRRIQIRDLRRAGCSRWIDAKLGSNDLGLLDARVSIFDTIERYRRAGHSRNPPQKRSRSAAPSMKKQEVSHR